MTDDPSCSLSRCPPSRYYSSSNRNCPPIFCPIYIYIYNSWRCFLGDRSVFDERLTNETSVRDRITKRVFARSKWKMIRGEGKGVFFNPVFWICIIISFPFFVTFLPHVSPPDFSFENKNSTCLFVQCILNGVERGVIFPNVEKQHGLETLLLSKLLFSKYLPQHLLIIANNEEIHHFTSLKHCAKRNKYIHGQQMNDQS